MDIGLHLHAVAKNYPRLVLPTLSQGSIVPKSLGVSYEIDDPLIHKRLGEFPAGAIPYTTIHNALKPQQQKIFDLFREARVIPFSRAMDAGIGECLEQAILVQLAAQTDRLAFLINGILEQEGQIGAEAHGYNIVFKEEKPYLVDVTNPLAKDAAGRVTHPYIAPVLDVHDGVFIVPEEWKQRRQYCLW